MQNLILVSLIVKGTSQDSKSNLERAYFMSVFVLEKYTMLELRRDKWMHYAIGHNVLLHLIQTKLSLKPDFFFFFQLE